MVAVMCALYVELSTASAPSSCAWSSLPDLDPFWPQFRFARPVGTDFRGPISQTENEKPVLEKSCIEKRFSMFTTQTYE